MTASTPILSLPPPEIVEGDPDDLRNSCLVVGASGTGKTHGIKRLIQAGFNVLYVSVENKAQEILGLRPKIVPLDGPVVDAKTGAKRPPNVDERYLRLKAFMDALASGKYREHNGRPIDILAFDGLMEVASVIKDYRFAHMPLSAKGETNTFALWGQIGDDLVDMFKKCRNAASDVSRMYGFPPVGIYATCGEAFSDKLGRYVYELPGNIAGSQLPYQFSTILRLEIRRDGDTPRYVVHTVASEIWAAKAPAGLFDPMIIGSALDGTAPDIGTIWRKLDTYYKTEAGFDPPNTLAAEAA